MAVDPHARRFLDMIAMGAGGEPTAQERRTGLRGLMRLCAARQAATGFAPAVESRDLTIPGPAGPLAARLYAPREAEPALPGLLFFHGGGLVTGDLDTHDSLCRSLSEAGALRLLAIDYRLAPEHPFPAAVEDALAAAAWIAANAADLGIDPGRLAVGGDSAGAGLAAMVCQQRRDLGFRAQLLLCPVLDPLGTPPSRTAFAQGYFLDGATLARDRAALGIDGHDPADPRLSPMRAPDLVGLPPALIHTAEYDIVRDDGEGYATRLAQARVPVRLARHDGQIHFFYGLAGLIPAAVPALRRAGAELALLLRDPRAAGDMLASAA